MSRVRAPEGAAVTAGVSRWASVVALIVGADQAVMHRSGRPGADDDLALTYVALDLSYVLAELEWAVPGVTAQVEPVPVAEIGEGIEAVRAGILSAVARGIELVSQMASDATSTTSEVISATRVAMLLGGVRSELAGRAR